MGGILMPGSGQFCSNNIFIKKPSRLQEFKLFKVHFLMQREQIWKASNLGQTENKQGKP
jgi:hypothetical protein